MISVKEIKKTMDGGNPAKWGEATKQFVKAQHKRSTGRVTFQGQVYNFLERPSGYICIIYHVFV